MRYHCRLTHSTNHALIVVPLPRRREKRTPSRPGQSHLGIAYQWNAHHAEGSMSIKLMQQVWEIPPGVLISSQKLVLLSLADQANDDGECWPSISTIARRSSMDERTVRRCLRVLASDGFLSITDRIGTSSRYRISIPGQIVTPDKLSPRTNCPPTPDKLSPHPGQIVPPPRTNCPPNPKEPPENPQGTKSLAGDASTQEIGDGEIIDPPKMTPGAVLSNRLLNHHHIQAHPKHPKILEWLDQGVTVDHVDQAVAKARCSKPTGEIAINYLVKVMPDILDRRNQRHKSRGGADPLPAGQYPEGDLGGLYDADEAGA